MRRSILVVLLMPLCWSALASPNATTLSLEQGRFDDQQAAIRKELQAGDQYREISPQDRAAALAALDRIDTTLSGAGGAVGALDANARTAVMEDEKLVNRLLTKAAQDSRLVCKREKPVGSNLPIRRCQTVAQRRRAREDAQGQLDGARDTRFGGDGG